MLPWLLFTASPNGAGVSVRRPRRMQLGRWPAPACGAQARQPVHDRNQEETFDESPQSDRTASSSQPDRACRLQQQQQFGGESSHFRRCHQRSGSGNVHGTQHRADLRGRVRSRQLRSAFRDGVGCPRRRTEPSAKTTISVDCEPPKTQALPRKDWEADVKTFEAAHPLITIKSIDTNPCVNPTTFNANLKAGKVANVFYVYNTDAQDVINKGQALNIQEYANTIPGYNDIIPAVGAVFKKGGSATGDLYGLPSKNYTLGLVYNRELFTKAGLDPNSPPTSWNDVIADAKKITALGNGTIGYADYSAGNTGGWHFTAEMYSQGGDITADGKTANFNNDKGTAVLNNLHTMRWVDNSMGTKQLLQYDDLNQMMSSGKLGMHIGAPGPGAA